MRASGLKVVVTLAALVGFVVPALAAGDEDIPRTASGRPDFTGHYDVATLTPLARPPAFGDNLFLTREEAEKRVRQAALLRAASSRDSDPDREAPPDGGDGSPGAAGNVGGYNSFWIDNGTDVFEIDGKFRTSIITHPKNGRHPALTEAARERSAARRGFWRANTGEAWWLERGGVGPYDDPELRPLAERCLLGFSSTAGPPMLPALYNNVKRIVQTEDHVMILVEMVHDARVVRIGGEHSPAGERRWLGDSIGWWEEDTLVIETTNFGDRTGLRGGTRDMRTVERFSVNDRDSLLYRFTVEDPNTWTESWSGEYVWPRTDALLYEYACHEGNYALGNIMRGARLLEEDALAATGATDSGE
ncbi:MAG: hypothetical protein F4060_07305 [Holophagales bacterium]|nr:hypothetical protein [Holophagales bacterium]MYG31890.1 hypothetical protein [Holophagales bacterium]MYI79732.1 hypothetical protein [Holophagales bacterium]